MLLLLLLLLRWLLLCAVPLRLLLDGGVLPFAALHKPLRSYIHHNSYMRQHQQKYDTVQRRV
jgi:hypothetical protein